MRTITFTPIAKPVTGGGIGEPIARTIIDAPPVTFNMKKENVEKIKRRQFVVIVVGTIRLMQENAMCSGTTKKDMKFRTTPLPRLRI